jgi:hypothetical protein
VSRVYFRGLAERGKSESEKADADIEAAKRMDPTVVTRIASFGLTPCAAVPEGRQQIISGGGILPFDLE